MNTVGKKNSDVILVFIFKPAISVKAEARNSYFGPASGLGTALSQKNNLTLTNVTQNSFPCENLNQGSRIFIFIRH